MKGLRIYPDAEGWLTDPRINQPGAYGRATNPMAANSAAGYWVVTAPDGTQGSLHPGIHTVTEHEDGSITVRPSIDFSKRHAGLFHGWLTGGIWSNA